MLTGGDIVLLDFPLAEQVERKVRPALVLSATNRFGEVLLAQITSNQAFRQDKEGFLIDGNDLASGSVNCQCIALLGKINTVSAKYCRKVARLKSEKIDALHRLRARVIVEDFAENKYTPKAFVPGQSVIPPSGKIIGAPELQMMVEASLDGWLTTGRFNAKFEKRLAEFLGAKYALTTNSGSSANLLALAALTSPKLGDRALRPGDEVITVAAGFPTTLNPILQYGLVPVFVDIHIPTYNIDPNQIEAAVSDRTRAIMLAHTLGNPFNLDEVMRVARKYDLWVVEDTCDALGSTYTPTYDIPYGRRDVIPAGQPKLVGGFGDVATLSFYPAHHITMGEGGAVYTDNGKLKPIIESIRDWGRDCYCAPGEDNTCGKRFDWQLGELPYGYDHKYTYSHLGYNLKISDMQAACALAQMDRLESFITARRNNFNYLHERLQSCQEFLLLPEATPKSAPSWFGFPVTIKEGVALNRVDLLRHLDDQKIGTRLLFAGNLIRQPYMAGRNYRVSGSLNNTDVVMNNTFWIGVYPALDKQKLEFVAGQIEQFLGIRS